MINEPAFCFEGGVFIPDNRRGKMIKDIFKRVTAGALSTITLLTTVPLAGAAGGIMPLAEEDNEASSIEINVGEVYTIADRGVQKAWFQQNGAPRNVWPMFTESVRRYGDPRILRGTQQG